MAKQKSPPPKPVTRSLVIDLGEEREIKAIGSTHDGPVVIDSGGRLIAPASSVLDVAYKKDRPDKPKKIVSLATMDKGPSYDHPDKYLMSFPVVIFIDTNFRTINGYPIHVSSLSSAQFDRNPITEQPTLIPTHLGFFEFHGVKDVPAEQVGWAQAVRCLDIRQVRNCPGAVALVTDHDLGNHQEFNRHKRRIAGLFYLPPEYTLVYGCADRGHHLINQFMKWQDAAANIMLDILCDAPPREEGLFPATAGEPFLRKRLWQPTQREQASGDLKAVFRRYRPDRNPHPIV